MLSSFIKKYQTLSISTRASLWFLVCSVLQKGISVITTPIFTRILTATEYGQFGVFNSWLSVITVFVTFSLTSGVYTMGIVKFKEEENVFTSSLQGLNLTLCLFWMFIYTIFRSFWNELFDLTTVQMYAMLLMIWTSATFSFWMTTQRNQYKYRLLVFITLLVSILKPLLGFFLVVHSHDKVTARILGLAIVELACYSIFFFIQMKKGKKFYSRKYWKYAIIFNFPLIPHYLSNVILVSSDRIMIQNINGESAAGIYTLAYTIASLMLMVNDALNKTMSPFIYQNIREKKYKSFNGVFITSLIIVGFCNLLLIAIAPEIIMIFAPSEYYDAVYVIIPVAMSGLFMYMYLGFAPFEFYFEKRVWTTLATFLSAVLNLFLNYIFINLCGYVAAGYTTLICFIINAWIHYYFMRKVCKENLNNLKPYDVKILLVISSGFVILGLIFIPMYSYPVIRYIFILIILLCAFINRKHFIPLLRSSFFKEK